jgi:hypothetical protein
VSPRCGEEETVWTLPGVSPLAGMCRRVAAKKRSQKLRLDNLAIHQSFSNHLVEISIVPRSKGSSDLGMVTLCSDFSLFINLPLNLSPPELPVSGFSVAA